LCRTARKILGDYGVLSSAKAISSSYTGHDTIFAALDRKRFVEIPEVDRALVLGARFKELTGGDATTGRGMRENERRINVDGKLFICANNNIKFDATSKSFRKRLRTVPFRNNVAVPDRSLCDRLLAEGPAILAAIIEEARKFLAGEAFPASAAVAETSQAYNDAADRYAEFFDACYVAVENSTDAESEALQGAKNKPNVPGGCPGTPLKQVFAAWQTWAKDRGEFVGDDKLLAAALRERDVVVKPHAVTRTFFVAGLLPTPTLERQRRAIDAAKKRGDDKEAERLAVLSLTAFEKEEHAKRVADAMREIANNPRDF
jgi:phage/plasmid-associated DNA primase